MKRNVPSECGGCGSEERWLLHNVRHREIYYRLCTSCVLKFHPGLFCPNCFEVYEGSSLPVSRVMCLRCPSVSHLACVSKDAASCYVCPSCLNPSFVFFDAGALNNKKSGDGDGGLVADGNQGAIDVKVAKVLYASAQIASISMGKAAAVARAEAEKRAKEAALARKRAREALERFSALAAKEKERGKGKVMEVAGRVSNYDPETKSKGNNASASALTTQMEPHKRFQNQYWADKVDKSGGIAASLNNIGLGEKERVVGFQAPNIVQGTVKNGVPIEDMDIMTGSPTPVTGPQQHQKAATVNEKEKSSNLPHLQKNGVQGEEKNGLSSVNTAATTLQHAQNSHGDEEGGGKLKGFVESGMDTHITHSDQDELVSKTNEGGALLKGSSSKAR